MKVKKKERKKGKTSFSCSNSVWQPLFTNSMNQWLTCGQQRDQEVLQARQAQWAGTSVWQSIHHNLSFSNVLSLQACCCTADQQRTCLNSWPKAMKVDTATAENLKAIHRFSMKYNCDLCIWEPSSQSWITMWFTSQLKKILSLSFRFLCPSVSQCWA